MHLITPYAPPSFLKPVILVSTLFNSATKETAIEFVDALHIWHALDVANCHERNCRDIMESDAKHQGRHSGWLVIETHASLGAALEFHLELTKDFINGGTEEEWQQGWGPYLELRARFEAEQKKEDSDG